MSEQYLGYNVDIVMCIDGTASMRPFIDELKANALSIYQKFDDAMEEAGKKTDEFRIKVIVFRDYGRDEKPMEESEFFTLPDQAEEFNAFVNGIEAKGGGDVPGNALEAIALALKSKWTTGGDRRRHTILVFSDAPALPLGERAACTGYPSGMPSDLAELAAWWEGTEQTDSPYQPRAGRLIVFAPAAYPWTDIQTWNRYWPAFSPAGKGLSNGDIQAAIDFLFEF